MHALPIPVMKSDAYKIASYLFGNLSKDINKFKNRNEKNIKLTIIFVECSMN